MSVSTQVSPGVIDYQASQTFLPGSRLRAYLAKKKPESNLAWSYSSTLQNILKYLMEIIKEEQLYDEGNTSIVICDKELEEALDVKALLLSEIREQVCKQLAGGLGALGGGGGGGGRKLGQLPGSRGGAITLATEDLAEIGASSRVSLTQTAKLGEGRFQQARRLGANCPATPCNSSDQTAPLPPSLPPPPPSLLRSSSGTGTASAPTYIPPDTRFTVTPAFRKVLAQLPSVPKDQEVFTYGELTSHLSQYILSRKAKFFDERNIKVALVDGDLLGEAFNVKAFHRSQVTNLLRSQLSRCTLPLQAGPTSASAATTSTVTASGPKGPSKEDEREEKVERAPCTPSRTNGSVFRGVVGSDLQEFLLSVKSIDDVTKVFRADVEPDKRQCEEGRSTRNMLDQTQEHVGGGTVDVGQEKDTRRPRLRILPPSLYPLYSLISARERDTMIKQQLMETASTSSNNSCAKENERSVISLSTSGCSKETRVRKRSPSPDVVGAVSSSSSSTSVPTSSCNTVYLIQAKRQRRRSSSAATSFSRNESFNEYYSDGEESIYSEQGYETVAICTLEQDDDGDTSSTNEVEEEVEEEHNFTEFEVDSEADKVTDSDNGEQSSAEDTDFQDVPVMVYASTTLLIEEARRADLADLEFFADSESASSSPGEEVSIPMITAKGRRSRRQSEVKAAATTSPSSSSALCNFDPELGPMSTETWQCVNCHCPNTPFIRYCGRCWQERKGWMPDRPKPRRRRRHLKNKRTEGQMVKGCAKDASSTVNLPLRPALNRSMSHQPSASTAHDDADKVQSDGDEKLGELSQADSGCFSQASSQEMLTASSEVHVMPSATQMTMEELSLGASRPLSSSEVFSDCSQEAHEERPSTLEGAGAVEASGGGVVGSSSSTSIKTALFDHSDLISNGSSSSPRSSTFTASNPRSMCNFCLSRNKDAAIIHGGIVHQVCCYVCAKRLYKRKQPCPMCRRPIEKIARIIEG